LCGSLLAQQAAALDGLSLDAFPLVKKRQGVEVQVLERVRQVGPNREGARGSFTIYRVV
jgi:hypothetical protein